MLILGMFVLRSSPHLSSGLQGLALQAGFRWFGQEEALLEVAGDRAREKPGFSFPCCLQLPSMAPAPAAKSSRGSSFSQVTQVPRLHHHLFPSTSRMLLIFPLLLISGVLLSLCYHLCNQLPALQPLGFIQNSSCFPCRSPTDLFEKMNLGSGSQGQSGGYLEEPKGI